MPDWKDAIHDRLRSMPLDPAREAEIAEELASHLDDRYRELLATATPAEAERAAAAELETLQLPPRPRRDPLPVGSHSGRNFMANLWHDLKVALRMARSRPGFSVAVVCMLAIGIAGNTAIFSIFNGLFLKPLPFPAADRLVDIDETAPRWNLVRTGVSNPDFDAWQKGNSTFEGMAFTHGGGLNLAEEGIPAQRVDYAQVTHNLLSVLGLKPALGRDFLPEEDRPNGPQVAMLGYDLWQRAFRGDPNILGRTVRFGGSPATIVGILPREAVIPPKAEVWVPLQADTTKGGSFYLAGIGRLKPGVSMQQAEADLRRIHFARPGYKDADAYPVLAAVRDRSLGDFKTVTRILLGGVAVVLLIACVNIAGLMLVRGESRSREIAIRTAIGASRGRIVRQLLTESLLLAAIGGIVGVLVGKAFLAGLVSLMPPDLPKWITFTLDERFAAFCAAVTGAAAIVFGLAPAVQAATVDARGALGESARSTLTRGKRAVLSSLVVCEIALALVLLTASGLLLQAFRKVLHTDPGFRAENTMTWSVRLSPTKYPKDEQKHAFYSSLVERLRAIPGVTTASAASLVPLGGHSGYFYQAEAGRTIGPSEKNPVVLQVTALPGYLETMGIQLVTGRFFDSRDEQRPQSILVNETFALHFWGNTDVVGKRVRYPGGPNWFEVIGVVRDMRHYGIDAEMRPEAFVTYNHTPTTGMTIAMRSPSDPRALVSAARDVLRQLDPELPMFDIRTMTERLDRSMWTRRAYSTLFGAFAIVAMLLAAAGIYGVISFAVTQRTREIGIRIALGARPDQVLRSVLASGMVLVAIGALAGLLAAQFTGALLKSMLFGVSPRDLATYGSVVAAIAFVGLLANYVPARRAAQVEPVRALRSE
jgi:putative ABC transport system permease protein